MTLFNELGVVEAAGPEEFRFVRPLRDDEIDVDAIADKRQRDLHRLLDMVQLAQSDDLRRDIRDYFQLDATH